MQELPFRPFFGFDDLQTEVVEGDVERVVYTGKHIQLVEYRFPANKCFTAHAHDVNEQVGYLVRGKMGFLVGERERILLPGDYYHAQVGQLHNGWTFDEPSVLIDIFSPVRIDLLARSNHWVRADRDVARRAVHETMK